MNNTAKKDASANRNPVDFCFQFEREKGQMRPDEETDFVARAKDSTTFSSEVCKGRIQGSPRSHLAPTHTTALDFHEVSDCVVNQNWNDVRVKPEVSRMKEIGAITREMANEPTNVGSMCPEVNE